MAGGFPDHLKKLPEKVLNLKSRLKWRRKGSSVLDRNEGQVSGSSQTPQEHALGQDIGEEEKQRRIEANVKLLCEEILFVDFPPNDNFARRQKRRGVSRSNKKQTGKFSYRQDLNIYYCTSTGEIRRPTIDEAFDPGEYSRVTAMVSVIERIRRATVDSRENGDINQLPFMEIKFQDIPAKREQTSEEEIFPQGVILPRRLNREERWRSPTTGEKVNWGQTAFEEDPSGDEIIFESLEAFNRQFGRRKTKPLGAKESSSGHNN